MIKNSSEKWLNFNIYLKQILSSISYIWDMELYGRDLIKKIQNAELSGENAHAT